MCARAAAWARGDVAEGGRGRGRVRGRALVLLEAFFAEHAALPPRAVVLAPSAPPPLAPPPPRPPVLRPWSSANEARPAGRLRLARGGAGRGGAQAVRCSQRVPNLTTTG